MLTREHWLIVAVTVGLCLVPNPWISVALRLAALCSLVRLAIFLGRK